MSRGYYGYKYQQSEDVVNNGPPDIAIKQLTSGTLFKVWGQISGDTTSYKTESNNVYMQGSSRVVSLSGRLMVKEWFKANAYYCSPKIGVYERQSTSSWVPDDEEDLEIPTEVRLEKVEDEKMETDTGTND